MVSDLAQTIFSCQNKMKMLQIVINTISLQHFLLLKGLVNSVNDLSSLLINVYVESLVGVSTNFATKFTDLENL